MRIRYYGFLADRCKRENLKKCRGLLGASESPMIVEYKSVREIILEKTGHDIAKCPYRKKGNLVSIETVPPRTGIDQYEITHGRRKFRPKRISFYIRIWNASFKKLFRSQGAAKGQVRSKFGELSKNLNENAILDQTAMKLSPDSQRIFEKKNRQGRKQRQPPRDSTINKGFTISIYLVYRSIKSPGCGSFQHRFIRHRAYLFDIRSPQTNRIPDKTNFCAFLPSDAG